MQPKRILILSSNEPLVPWRNACDKLGFEMITASALELDLSSRDAVLAIVSHSQHHPLAAIIPLNAQAATIAARASSMMGLEWHPPKAADVCADSALLRRKLENVAVPVADTGDIRLAILVTHRKMRVLGNSHPEIATAHAIAPVLNRTRDVVGLKHGPMQVTLAPADNGVAVAAICVAAHDDYAAQLRFAIPLVDERLTYEELVVRHALSLDVSRVYPRKQEAADAR